MYDSDFLIVVDDEMQYGINHGYYPDIAKQVKNGTLTVVPLSKNVQTECHLTTRPLGEGKDMYIRNPYADQYVQVEAADIQNIFVQSQAYAVKEALVRMGAKYIRLTDDVSDVENTGWKGEVGASKMGMGGDITAEKSRFNSLDLRKLIESEDPNRAPRDAKNVREFMQSHGLMTDGGLVALLERLECDGELHGKEHYNMVLLSYLSDAFHIAANLNLKAVTAKLDFSKQSQTVHRVEKNVSIWFDVPTDTELDQMHKEDEETAKRFSADRAKR